MEEEKVESGEDFKMSGNMPMTEGYILSNRKYFNCMCNDRSDLLYESSSHRIIDTELRGILEVIK